jgi:hypothetical protein
LKKVKKALVGYFTHDLDGHRRLHKPSVGVSVTLAAPRFCVGMTLTYRAGMRYCCTAPMCQFSPVWGRLRELLQANGVAVEHPMRIFLHCVYERERASQSMGAIPRCTDRSKRVGSAIT